MNTASLHPVPWEHAPAAAPWTLLAAALGFAFAGVSILPRSPTPPAAPHVARVLDVPRLHPPSAEPSPAGPLPAEPSLTMSPPTPPVVPAPPPATTPPDPNCPPRWSVRFAYGSARVPVSLATHAPRLRAWLAAHPGSGITVVGFADPAGNEFANEALSLRRAMAVARALSRNGISWARIATRGAGTLGAIVDEDADADALRSAVVRVRGVRACASIPEEVIAP